MKCKKCSKEMQETYTFNSNPVRVRGTDYCSGCWVSFPVSKREKLKGYGGSK